MLPLICGFLIGFVNYTIPRGGVRSRSAARPLQTFMEAADVKNLLDNPSSSKQWRVAQFTTFATTWISSRTTVFSISYAEA